MLLFYFIYQYCLRMSLSKRIEENSCWYSYKEKNIQKYEENKKSVYIYRILNCQNLIVRIGIIRGKYIHDKNHLTQIPIILCELIILCTLRYLDNLVSYYCKADNNEWIKEYINKNIFICSSYRFKGFSGSRVIEKWKN